MGHETRELKFLATPEKGEALVRLAVTGLIDEVRTFGAEAAPA